MLLQLAWGVGVGGKARLGNAPVTLGAVLGSGLVRGTRGGYEGTISHQLSGDGVQLAFLRANVVVSVFNSGVVHASACPPQRLDIIPIGLVLQSNDATG